MKCEKQPQICFKNNNILIFLILDDLIVKKNFELNKFSLVIFSNCN